MADLVSEATRSNAPKLPERYGTGFVVGCGEDVFLGEGWHEREVRGLDHTPYRGVGRSATFRLRLRHGAQQLTLLATAPVPLLGRPYRGWLLLGNQELGEIVATSDSWVVRTFDLPTPAADVEVGEFTLLSQTVCVPADCIEGSRDFRTIGCYVGAVLLSPVVSADSS